MKAYTISLALLVVSLNVHAQATKANNDPDADFKYAKELYQKEQFSLAYSLFKTLGSTAFESNMPVTLQLEAKYYLIVCGLRMNDETAATAAKEFITGEHNTARVQMLSYQLAEYYYRRKDFETANNYYEQAGLENLSNREIADMKFHQAYGYFSTNKFSDAKPLFDAIRQIPTDPNYIDANYYYGFIVFSEKKYNEALSAFKIVENEPAYQNIVPYYVTEIYYFNGEKDKAIASGEAAIKKGGQYYNLQLKQLLGHAYFDKKEFDKALPYLEEYVSKTEKVSREDLYELSYCYYEAGQLQKAITGLRQLGGKQDSLAQNSMYLLGDAYLKTNQKSSARNAFLFCALNSSNAEQKEISRFHYAKLSYELGYEDAALNELKNFVGAYPKSDYIEEAKEILVTLLANTNNYNDALNTYNAIKDKNERIRKIYPKLLYGRAIELINDQQLAQADNMLNAVLNDANANELLQPAYFWKGELAYRNNKTDSAIDYLMQYQRSPVTYGEVNNMDATYTLGYSYLKIEDYAKALQNFEKVAASVSSASTPVQADAYLRSADCYFMQKQYSKALQMYEAVINQNLAGADYAYYQKAIISGANNRNSEKIMLLKAFTQRYQSSPLVGDANMGVADAYMSEENFKDAIPPLNTIIKSNAAALKPQAFLKTGVCYFNLNDNNNALNSFRQLVKTYPNSAESDDAVDYVRNIYLNNQQPNEFVNFMRQNGKTVSYSEEDSLNYIASIKNAATAPDGLENYLSKFPDGKYAVNANYQLAENYNAAKNYNKALPNYLAVAAKAPNKFAEASVLQAAHIYYFQLKDFAKAEQYFIQLKEIAEQQENKLEAMRGLLRCQYKLQQFTDAADNAQDLLQQEGIAADDKMMANMVIAKNYQAQNKIDEAADAYQKVIAIGKSEYAAEARYCIAEILFNQNKLKDAEKAGFDVIKKSGYDYWITKAYILLGDIYFKEQDYFNAEATFKSVAENASDASLKNEAQQKLDKVVAEKDKNSKVAEAPGT